MSRIEDLIAKYCPNGVKYEPVNMVFHSLPKGTLKQNQLESDGQYPVINSGRDFYGFYSQFNNDCEAIVIASRGEYAGFVSYMSGKFWAGGLCYPYAVCDTNILLPKYAFYYLKSKEQHIMDTLVSRGSIPALNKADIDKFNIPVPPLAVQEEIVNILDSFTLLEAELEAELEARKQQYEHYRAKLFHFDDGDNKCEIMSLGDIVYYPNERVAADTLTQDNYVGVENLLKDRQGKTISSYVPTQGRFIKYKPNDILIGNIRPYLKKIWMADNDGGTNGDVVLIRIKENKRGMILSRFLYHVLMRDEFFNYDNQYAKGGKMPRGDRNAILKFPVTIPSLVEQERIVGILDKFDALVNDISDGLPAEINARRQQYEYYRDKLLNFEPIAA